MVQVFPQGPNWCVDNGVILLVAGIPITFCSVLFGLSLFSSAHIPEQILMAPGLLGAVVLLYILGFFLVENRAIGILVAGLVGSISLWMSVVMIRSVY